MGKSNERSFALVDEKLAEADFFLDKLTNASPGLWPSRFYFSAFVSSARSITFALQAVMTHLPEFCEWYERQREILKNDPICRFFLKTRTENQHIGLNQLSGGIFAKRDDGSDDIRYYFDSSIDNAPDKDVVMACTEYLTVLTKIIALCYLKFGKLIDPFEYYTLENMKDLGLSIEDFEEQVGMPRGWTFVPNCTEEDRLGVIRREITGSEIRPILDKYLGEDWPEKISNELDK